MSKIHTLSDGTKLYYRAPCNAPEGNTHLIVYGARQDEDDHKGILNVGAAFSTIKDIEETFARYPHLVDSSTVYELVQVPVKLSKVRTTKDVVKVGKAK